MASEAKVPSRILIPLLPLAANVIFVNVGFDFKDIAIGSALQFCIDTQSTFGVELPSHLTP